jgi:cyclohexa-1,5-dienecarbonyl-CoA hydratase
MSTATTTTVHASLDRGVARILLDRAPLNIIDISMMQALAAALTRVLPYADVLVLRGAGAQAFSAGVEVRDHLPERVGEMLRSFHSIFRQIDAAKCLTIAAVQGHCLGGGCELATFCDFVIATESATFGQPEIKLGCFPPVAMVTLPRLCGLRAAQDLILTGRTISAAEAQKFGLVTRVVPDDRLDDGVDRMVDELIALSPAILQMARGALRRGAGFNFERELAEIEKLYLGEMVKTADAAEGVRAFIEKRAPAWKGR